MLQKNIYMVAEDENMKFRISEIVNNKYKKSYNFNS